MTFTMSTQPLVPGHWQIVVSDGKRWARAGLGTYATVQDAPSQSPFTVDQAETTAPGGRSVLFGPSTSKTWAYSFELMFYGDSARRDMDALAGFFQEGIGTRNPDWTVTVGRHGQPPLHLVGKPRVASPDYQLALKGAVHCRFEFTVVHQGWFEPAQTETWQIVPTLTGGVVFPVVFPVVFATSSSNLTSLSFPNAGVTPIITFRGPVGTPSVRFGDQTLKLATTLGENETITVDTRPWALSVTDQAGSPRLKDLDPRSTRLTDLRLPAGTVPVEFAGTSPSATAAVDITWHATRATLT